MPDYSVRLHDRKGAQIATLDTFSSLDAARAANEAGGLTLTAAASDVERAAQAAGLPWPLRQDDVIDLWLVVLRRAGTGWRTLLGTAWQIQDVVTGFKSGLRMTTLKAKSANVLLASRAVLYAAGSAQASMTNQYDDMMRQVVRDNFTAPTVAARTLGTPYLSVGADLAQAPSGSKDFAWRNVLTVLQEIAQASYEGGTPLYFDVRPTAYDPLAFEFVTAITQLGTDHTATGAVPLEFSLERGNLSEYSLEYDATSEANAVTVGGQGEGTARATATAEDTSRSTRGPYSRRERFVDARNSTGTGLQAEADAALQAGKPRRILQGTILDAPGSRYGIDWQFGDRVIATAENESASCRINTVQVKVDDGRETITARLSNQDG